MYFLSTIGIIAEFNPMHQGHKYIIDCAKKVGNTVICVLSGNFVQRGDVAILSKEERTKSALICGADIVAELPVLWSMSTAQNFALGGVWQLYNLNCEEIIFGSECGDIEAIETMPTTNIAAVTLVEYRSSRRRAYALYQYGEAEYKPLSEPVVVDR